MGPNEIRPFLLRNPVASGLHLLWAVWALYAAALLWRLARGDRLRQWSVGCFGLSMVLLYSASGAFHAVPADRPALVQTLRLLDHSAIYLLIAGTYTPIFAVLLRGRLRLALLVLMWLLAVVGIVCKWAVPWPPYTLTVLLYLAMGWVGVLALYPLTRVVGLRGMVWGVFGGLLYTVGAVCEATSWPVLLPGVVGAHEVLHLCDMGGTFTHVVFVTRYVIPLRA
jgi:hemolysin III